MPAAFTLATTRDHWEVLLRARAIENQSFVIAANQIGAHPGGYRSGGRSMIVDPWGLVLATAPDAETAIVAELDFDAAARRPAPAAVARPPAARGVRGWTSWRSMPRRPPQPAVDKRRMILDAAVRVFARQGFHTCRVSDIADEAGVAYGLVYHYFSSKEEILDTLFLERWDVMLAAIAEVDASARSPREKLHAIAGVHRRLLPPRPRADEGDHRRGDARGEHVRAHAPGEDPRGLQPDRRDRRRARRPAACSAREITPEFAALAFYGLIEQVLTGWIFDSRLGRRGGARAGEDADRRDDLPRSRGLGSRRPHRPGTVWSAEV